MQREKKDKHFIKKPFYEGGLSAMRAFISKNLAYPEEAREKQIEGTVHIRYTIDRTGAVIGTKVIAGIGHGCDEEASRVVRMLKFHAPKNLVQNIKFHKTIQIHFRLPAHGNNDQLPQSTLPQGMHYNYSVVPSEKQTGSDDDSQKKGSSSGGYTYTVPLN